MNSPAPDPKEVAKAILNEYLPAGSKQRKIAIAVAIFLAIVVVGQCAGS